MIPAQEGLHTDNFAARHLHYRLIVDHEFMALNRPSEIVGQLELLQGISLHTWLEYRIAGLACGLGAIHCCVRIAQQIVYKNRPSNSATAQGYPNAGRD